MKHCVQCTKIPSKRVEVQFKGDGVRTTFCTDKCLAEYRATEKNEVLEAVWDVDENNVAFMRPAFDEDKLRCPVSQIDGSGIRHRCSKEKSHEKDHSFKCEHASPIMGVLCQLDYGHEGYHQNGATSWIGDCECSMEPTPPPHSLPGLTQHIVKPREYSHYFKDVSKLQVIDVYRVLDLWGVTDPCVQHALKKLLCAGQRGGKDMTKDIKEVIASCQRWLEMQDEQAN